MTIVDKPWLNASLAVDARVALLLAAMTLDEKVAQLGYDISPSARRRRWRCAYAATGAKATIGEAGRLYGVYL